jgi:hypothetical protein
VAARPTARVSFRAAPSTELMVTPCAFVDHPSTGPANRRVPAGR